MSHVKNVVAYEELVGYCSGNSGGFNPGSPNLQLLVMNALGADARQALQKLKVALTDYQNATNSREAAYKDLAQLSTQIIGALKAVGANSQTIADAQAMARRISGGMPADRKPVPSVAAATAAGQEDKKVRVSLPRDYETLAEYFAKMVQTISTEAKYTPNEANLTLAGLQAKLNALRQNNSGVTSAKVNLSNARINRNAILYTNETNLYDTAIAVKAYVKSVYGVRSEQYRQVVKLKFTKPNA